MPYKFLAALCFLFCFNGHAQDSAIDSLKTILQKQQQLDTLRISRLLDLSYRYRLNDLDSARAYIDQALNTSIVLKDKKQEGVSRLYLARHFKRQGKYTEGLQQIILAKHLLDSTGASRKQRLNATSELGTFYEATKDYQKALEMSLVTLEMVKEDPVTPNKGRFYYDVGNRYLQLNQYQNALQYYEQAVAICEQTNFVQGKMIMLGSLAQAYKGLKRYSEAVNMIETALPFFQQAGQKTYVAASYQQLGQIATLQGLHEASIGHYEKARAIFDEVGNLEYSKNTSQSLYLAYSIVQDHQKALAAQEVYSILRDSLESVERRELAAEMRTKYETEKIALAKEVAEAKVKRNKYYLLGAIIITGLVLISSLFFIGRMRARKQAELVTVELRETQKRLALEKQYRDSELKALKSQMNPHFIFNALNSIQEYIVLNKKNEASDYLGKFADLIRTYLNHSDTGLITLQEEVESLNMYLDLESLRFEDKLNYELIVSQKLNKELISIPTMLIQPYVENALKHGLLHKKENRYLKIQFDVGQGDTLQCTVIDNGVGRKKAKEFESKKHKLHKSFAAKATEERLELLNFGKDKKIGVTIFDLHDNDNLAIGTKVVLKIPILKR